jgi:voltage-gated potassium channel
MTNAPLRRIKLGALVFIATLMMAIGGYKLSSCNLLDSVYMVVITVFGVGYGEMCPITTPVMKIFTMFVIIGGTSSAVYTVGGFFQMMTEGEIEQALGVRRMNRGIETLRDHVIICGFGRIGQMLAKNLWEAHLPFVVIDNSGDRIAEAEALGYLIKIGNATDETVLQSVGITHAKCLATVLPDDAANVFITLTARELSDQLRILARGERPSTEKKLRLAGADEVILPASISAQRMTHMITHPATLEFFDQESGRTSLNEMLSQVDIQIEEIAIAPNSPMVGNTIGDIEVRGKGTFIIVALRQNNGTVVIHPKQTTLLQEQDVLIVLGHRGDLPKIVDRYIIKPHLQYRGARVES